MKKLATLADSHSFMQFVWSHYVSDVNYYTYICVYIYIATIWHVANQFARPRFRYSPLNVLLAYTLLHYV